MIDQLLQNDLAVAAVTGVFMFFAGVYVYQYYIKSRDESLFDTVDWAEDVIAPTLRSDMQTWGEKCRIKFMQDFDLKYFAIRKKRFNVVSNLEERLKEGTDDRDFPGSKKFIERIRESDQWEDGVMMFRMIKPMLTKSYLVNYLIYLLVEKPGLKRVSWLVVMPRQWVRYSSDVIQLHKDAQFFELVDGIHYAESLEVWKAFYGVHYSELHESVLEAFNNQYAYMNKFYPEHAMDLQEIQAEAEAEKEKYNRGVVSDANN